MTQEIWKEIDNYLEMGISVIAVRDREETINGRVFPAKTPIHSWKKYQTEIIERDKLWDIMDKKDCSAPAIVCGTVSGNLEIIDIDEKYNPGISAKYLSTIRDIYFDLYAKLRIHKTPSGGFHIIYRCEEHLGSGNMKIACRLATEDELLNNPKGGSIRCFIETRGEGGYAVVPPAMGYTLTTKPIIPVLTLDERNCLLNIATSFDKRPIEKEQTIPKGFKNNYDVNPFEDYNNSQAGRDTLLMGGWTLYNDNNHYTYYTRPGKNDGISASFIKDKGLFYFFTTSTEFEGSKGYLPSTVLSIIMHNGDKKETFKHLVENGFGKLNPQYEKKLISAAIQSGKDIPENLSPESKKEYKKEKKAFLKNYPHGVFWSGDAIEGYKISRENLLNLSIALGFSIMDEEQIILVEGYKARRVSKRFYITTLKDYIKEKDNVKAEAIYNSFENFMQHSLNYTVSRLPVFDNSRLLVSQRTVSYKFYRNCFIEITALNGIVMHEYEDIRDRLVWIEDIYDRDFSLLPDLGANGLYADFINKAVVNPTHASIVLGYLAHDYKDETMGFIPVLTEAVPDPKNGGGSGKNVFTSLIAGITSLKDVSGSQVQMNEKFYQAWNGERIFSISDVSKRFDFSFLKNLSTGTGIIKKLFKDERSLSADKLPKLIISTNYSYEIKDGGLKRRLTPIEFTDFFTLCGGVDTHYGGRMFPMDWNDYDWLGYDNFIATSIRKFLLNPKIKSPELTNSGWSKQFVMIYNEQTYLFIEEHIDKWLKTRYVPVEDIAIQYNKFCSRENIPLKYQISGIKLCSATADYAEKRGLFFDKDCRKSINGATIRCRLIMEKAPF